VNTKCEGGGARKSRNRLLGI